jgi:hypothetical protein
MRHIRSLCITFHVFYAHMLYIYMLYHSNNFEFIIQMHCHNIICHLYPNNNKDIVKTHEYKTFHTNFKYIYIYIYIYIHIYTIYVYYIYTMEQ